MAMLENALSPDDFIAFRVIENSQHTHNFFRLVLAAPLGKAFYIPITSCVLLRALVEDKENSSFVIRPYSPTSSSNCTESMEFIIKSYTDGLLSKYLANLGPGSLIDVKGPIIKIKFPFPSNVTNVGMLAGGTGITPMFQILTEMDLHNYKTNFSLVFANKTVEDIILKKELETLAEKHPNFKVHFVVSSLPKRDSDSLKTFKGTVGHIDEKVIRTHLVNCFPPSKNCKVLVCGPPRFMDNISGKKMPDKSQGELKAMLKKLGFDEENVFKF